MFIQVEQTTASGRRVKKRILDEQEGTSSRSKRLKKSKLAQRTSRRKSTKSKSLRPQRVAARNAINNFSQIPETSTDEDCEYASAIETSDSESSLEGSSFQRKIQNDSLLNVQREYMASSNKSEEVIKPCLSHPDGQINVGNKKKLVLRFSLHHRNPPTLSENHVSRLESQTTIASSSSRAYEETPEEDRVNNVSGNLASSSASMVDKERSEGHKRQPKDNEKPTEASNELPDANVIRAKFKTGASNGTQLGELVPMNVHAARSNGCMQFDSNSEVLNKQFVGAETDLSTSDLHGSSSLTIDPKPASEPLTNSKKKLTIIKIKSKKVPEDSPSRLPGKNRSDASTAGAAVESTPKTGEEEPVLGVLAADNCSDEPNYSPNFHVNGDEFYDGNPNVSFHDEEAGDESPDLATDSSRRARSLRLKATSLEMGVDYLQPGTSRSADRSSKKTAANLQSEGSKYGGRSKSSSNKREDYYREDVSSLVERNEYQRSKKTNWLLLSEQEVGNRYIPQLGDEVVYLRQV